MAIRAVNLAILSLAASALLACQPSARDPGDVRATRAWARATAPGQDSGGVFLTIRGGGSPDRLVGGSTEAARSVEIHSMRMDGAVMRMRRQQAVDIPAEGKVALEPGGTHLMLVGVPKPLRSGERFRLGLEFENAGRRDVTVEVLPIGASGPRSTDDD